jgi:predicted glycosyltransferase
MTPVTRELEHVAGLREPMRIQGAAPKSGKRKKVWIDIDNSPHVPFFLPIVEELEKQGIELILTARNIYQVRELLEFFHLPCTMISRHYRKNKCLKVLGTFLRRYSWLRRPARLRPDVAISHGSRAQLLISKALESRPFLVFELSKER